MSFVYSTFIISFILSIIFNNSYSNVIFPINWRTSFLDEFTFLTDPLLIQLFTFLLFTFLYWNYLKKSHPEENRFKRLLVSFFIPILIFILSYVLEQLVLKPAFRYKRPGIEYEPLENPWFLNFIIETMRQFISSLPIQFSNLLFPNAPLNNLTDPNYQDVPSGFAMRQLIILYITIWIVLQKIDDKESLTKKIKIILFSFEFIAFILVAFSRIYRAAHSVFAITTAVSVTTVLVWISVSIFYVISPNYRRKFRPIVSEIFAAYIAISFFFYFYSNDVGEWLKVSMVVLLIFTLSYLIPESA